MAGATPSGFGIDAFTAMADRYMQGLETAAHFWGAQRKAARAVSDLGWNHANKMRREIDNQLGSVESSVEREAPHWRSWATGGPARWAQDWAAYATDAMQRQLLTVDTLRERGNIYVEHMQAGMPPVLDFAHEVVIDGRELERPVNYSLLKITPPPGVNVDDDKRPFMIVDPRAGHGSGIGGFKPDSQVGEAFGEGHPVYFVAFNPMPEPGQTLADVRDAEVEFIKEIARRHPKEPKPAVIGNCQGGWAVMLLASDIGKGLFDGAWLVSNFENLNPANTFFKKYYHLYANVDTEPDRFLEFERWWGGYYLMNEQEIRWIVENLFVGNRLARGEARLGREAVDLRRIESPIIVFASHGDNITPPQQALNWIADLYANVDEIKLRGQRIVYMIHESIGHLGIFVSGKVASREHDAITDTLRAIDALAPGLYEMKLDDAQDRVHIRFEPRSIDDILGIDDGREDEELFASVARLSELGTEFYDIAIRPWVQAAVTSEMAQASRDLQPLRTQRLAFSNQNPWMPLVGAWAEAARAKRQRADAGNAFAATERIGAEIIEKQLDALRDLRDGWMETAFHAIYGSPVLQSIGRTELEHARERRVEDIRTLPEVRAALDSMTEGGVTEGVVRMLGLMAKARGYMRRSRLESLLEAVAHTGTLGTLDDAALARLLRQQQFIVDLEPEQALATLPVLLGTEAERETALQTVAEISGPQETMNPAALVLFQRFETMLGTRGNAAAPAS